MSKKPFKSQASSSRAFSGGFAGTADGFGTLGLGGVTQSQLSHVYEPPDLSGLSDPHTVVAFKNLQKKDGTTKTKALEDLQAYTQTQKGLTNDLEETFLEAWVRLLDSKWKKWS